MDPSNEVSSPDTGFWEIKNLSGRVTRLTVEVESLTFQQMRCEDDSFSIMNPASCRRAAAIFDLLCLQMLYLSR
jgi:hypothetical protein